MSEFLASMAAKAVVLLLEALIVRALQAMFAPAPRPVAV